MHPPQPPHHPPTPPTGPLISSIGSGLAPSRFVFSHSSSSNSLTATPAAVDSGSDREREMGESTPRDHRSGSLTPVNASAVSAVAATPTHASAPAKGGKCATVAATDASEGDEAQKAVEVVRQKLAQLNLFVAELPNQIATLSQHIDALETRKQKDIKTRDDLPLLHRIEVVQNYLKAVRNMIQSRTEEKLLIERMRQMSEFYQRIPISEKNERSLVESWNSMFDVHAIVPKPLAKDHCDYCKKPLLLIRKQAQLQCTFCGRMTEHLMPIAHANAWMKTNVNAQPENKRIKSVLAKLNQFRVGTPPIPSEIILGVRHWLKSRSHISNDSIALPAPVAAALTALGFEKYVSYAAKIANIVNGHDVCELTDEQINEIISRLRVVQFVFNMLQGKLPKIHFYTNFFVHEICKMRGWNALANCFPVQRTKRILREQCNLWKQLLHFLRKIDSSNAW